MDSVRKKLLHKTGDSLKRDLEIDFLLGQLRQKNVLTVHDVGAINSKITQEQKTQTFLDILEGEKTSKEYDKFVDCLKDDYSWLYDILRVNDETDLRNIADEQSYDEAISLADVPRLPAHYIERTDMLEELRTALKQLRRGGRIVLHGMTGSGKSCLAGAAVRDEQLLRESFRNKLFWFHFKKSETEEQILKHLHRLNQRLIINVENNSLASSNSLMYRDSIDTMRDYLKNKLAISSEYSESLLILDNVCSKDIIPAFDVGCKMIITTQDIHHVDVDLNTHVITVQEGFTEEETLSLFAKALSTDMKTLRRIPETKILSDHCKGQPMLVDLIGTNLKPYKADLLSNPARWVSVIDKLSSKKYDGKFAKIFKAIGACIEDLSSELKDKYLDFVVFVDDVNIMPETLRVLWQMDLLDVQEIMVELENKSLVVSYYNQDRKEYIYGIHNLLLDCLLNSQTKEDIRKKHIKLIKAYQASSNGDYSSLPNDNYIYQYIGYHLKHAELFSEFPKVYFDLNFIGAKIRATGIADLLRDFELYKDHITNNNERDIEHLEILKKFIHSNGQDLHRFQHTDIIQRALQLRSDSPIYKKAFQCALQRNQSVYFKIQAPQENHYYTHTLNLHEDFNAACFTETTNEILVGTRNGNINLWEQTYNKLLCTYTGHEGSIISLKVSPDKLEFLSVGEDGTLKVWKLHYFADRNSNNYDYLNGAVIPSPRLKQDGHQRFFGGETTIDRCKTYTLENKEQIISAAFSNDYERSHLIVFGSNMGKVYVCNVKDYQEKIQMAQSHTIPVNCVSFSSNDEIVVATFGSFIGLFNAENGSFLSQFSNRAEIKSLLVVPDYDDFDHCVVAINNSSITMWTYMQQGNPSSIINPQKISLCQTESEVQFLCGAITEDGDYLVVASSDHYTRMWNIREKSQVENFLNKNGFVISLDTLYENDNKSVHILLSGSDDKTIKQLHIYPDQLDYKDSRNLPIYDTFWENNSLQVAIANNKNKLQILNGRSIQQETGVLQQPIRKVCFSKCGGKVAYGLQSGEVAEYDLLERKAHQVMALPDDVVFLQYFETNEAGSQILVAASEYGTLMVYGRKGAHCLRRPVTKVPIKPIVQSFFIRSVQKLLTISKNGSTMIWNVNGDGSSVLSGDKNSSVAAAVVSEDESLMAVAMTDGTFDVYSLQTTSGKVELNRLFGKRLDNPLSSCAISHDKKYLALGKENGSIEIWSLEAKANFTTLPLHKSTVWYLCFSPAPDLVLISVGEQIAWWDIGKVPIEQQNRSKSFRRRSNSVKKELNLNLSSPNLSVWSTKQGHGNKPHLLSAVKLFGQHATSIKANQDFSSFFTVDSNGEIYIMDLLNAQ